MKRTFLPLFALTVLLGACSSLQTGARYITPPAPIPTGTRATAWGNLPTYDQRGHYFVNLSGRPLVNAFDATVVFDVLVQRDGKVQDVSLRQSSGNENVDRQTMARVKTARYTMNLGPDDPAPYVVNQTIVYRTDSFYANRGGIDPANQKYLTGPPPPTPESIPPTATYTEVRTNSQ